MLLYYSLEMIHHVILIHSLCAYTHYGVANLGIGQGHCQRNATFYVTRHQHTEMVYLIFY